MYAIDSDQGFNAKQNLVLLKMGKYMEKMMQMEADEFKGQYIIDPETGKAQVPAEQEEDYYNYATHGNFML